MMPFFIFGMFRSGTTSLARALNAHPEISCASDPAAPLFKAFRSHVAAGIGMDVPAGTPLQDYYGNPDGARLFSKIWDGAKLDLPLGQRDRDNLIQAMLPGCQQFSANLASHLPDLRGATFGELLDDLLAKVVAAYPSTGRAVGIKEVWSNEFAPAILRSDPRARVVFVVRDPRAVAASKNVLAEKYPWDFLARQWRKTTAVALAAARSPQYGERVHLLRYEDLVQDPESQMRRICKHLQIDWHADVLDGAKYQGGDGKAWQQNSSHGATSRSFNSQSVERWRSILSPRETALVELICQAEMTACGYEPTQPDMADALCANPGGAPVVPMADVAQWMKGQVDGSPAHTRSSVAQACETRMKLATGNVADAEVGWLFLHHDLFAAVASGQR